MAIYIDPITGQPFFNDNMSISPDVAVLVTEDPNARTGPFGGIYTADPEYKAPIDINNMAVTNSSGVDVGFSDLARLLETGANAYINLDRARTALQISRDSNAMARAASRNIFADPMFMIAVAGLLVALMKS